MDTVDKPNDAPPPLQVLITSSYFEPGFRAGGPVRSVARIIDTVPDRILPTLVTGARDLGVRTPYPGLSGRWVSRGRAEVFYLNGRRPAHWLRLWRRLRSTRFDLLYVNSLWATFSLVAITASRLRLIRVHRILIAPRGECSIGALSQKARKKRLFLTIWRRFLRPAQVRWHASTQREAADITKLFPTARIDVNQDQSDIPPTATPPPDPHSGPARLVFVGRIAPLKNLAEVLVALAGVRSPVDFDIYGPIEDARYWRRCRALLDRLPANIRAAYRGTLAPAEVRDTFHRYDAFTLLTAGENFGHVIAESLSASCPVLCSDHTPWSDVLDNGGGAVVRPATAAVLAEHIEKLAASSPQQRYAARLAASTAYERWYRGVERRNILDQVCGEVTAIKAR